MRTIYLLLVLCFISSVQYLASGEEVEASSPIELESDIENENEKDISNQVETETAVNTKHEEKKIDKEMKKKTDADYTKGNQIRKYTHKRQKNWKKPAVKMYNRKKVNRNRKTGRIMKLKMPSKMQRVQQKRFRNKPNKRQHNKKHKQSWK